MIAFPNSMPGVLLAAFSATEQSHVRSNEVSSGPPLFELMTADTPLSVSVAWSLSRIQFQIFEAWFKYVCKFGSLSFGLKLPVGSGTIEHECWFATGTYQHSFSGKRVSVTTNLIAAKKIYETPEFSVSVLLLDELTSGDEDLFTVLGLFNDFVEIFLPLYWGV